MERIGLIICAALCVGYLALNLVTAIKLSAKEMRRRYITGQCVVGRIAAGIFYAPAWLFKGIKFIILYFASEFSFLSPFAESFTFTAFPSDSSVIRSGISASVSSEAS